MIGQELFKNYLNTWINPPHFILLEGELGSGRSVLIDLILKKYKFNSIICGQTVDEVRDIIQLSYKLNTPTFYIFYNGDKLSTSAKNALLKIVEETPKNAYFIIRCENDIMETLKNRSFYYKMQPYTPNELKEYFCSQGKENIYNKYGKISHNIGQIKTFLNSPYEDIVDYCDIIITQIKNVVQGNIFNITNKIDLTGDSTKWDLILFINILEWKLSEYYNKTKDDKYFQAIFRLSLVKKQIRINGVNKTSIIDNYLLGLKYLL